MLVPSAIFFHKAQDIAVAVEGAKVPAIYPEREYKDAHSGGYKGQVIFHGHNIKQTFQDGSGLRHSYSSASELRCAPTSRGGAGS